MYELNPAERELITKLVEEASEVIKEACKMLNHGKLTTDDNGFRYNNVKKLSIETGDFLNMVELCRNNGLIDGQITQESWDKKRNEIWQYLKHNKKPPAFVVVKHANERWNHYWEEDPKITGVTIVHSAADSHTGQQLGISPSYYNQEDAQMACIKMNHHNPSGNYAVCPLLKE